MKKYLIYGVAFFVLLAVFPGIVLAEDFQLASGQTINVALTSPSVTYTLTSSTGIDTILVNGSTMTLTLSAGDSVTVVNAQGYNIPNDLSQATQCTSGSSKPSTITFTQTAVITANSTVVCANAQGGSGGSVPSDIGITINNGGGQTSSNNVVLTLTAKNAASMIFSNSMDFNNSIWVDYATTRNWTLISGDGEKRVYVKFSGSSSEESMIISDTITLAGTGIAPQPTPTPVPTTTGGGSPANTSQPAVTPSPTGALAPSLEGKLVKDQKKSSVFIIENGKLRPYLNGKIFLSYGKSFDNVISADISSYPVGEAISLFPDSYNFTCGQLVKASNAKVYIVSRCDEGEKKEITWVETESVFLAGGWKFNNLNYISDAKKSEFSEIGSFNAIGAHPAGTLVKYADSSKVYLLRNVDGVVKKSWIASEAEFNRMNFQMADMVTIPTNETYADGSNMGGVVLGVSNDIIVSNLQKGSSGDEVMLLQRKLKQAGYFPQDIEPNGYFGPVTENAVKDLQVANNISPIGRVGPQTRLIVNSL